MPPLLLASSSSSSPALAPPRPSCRGRVRVAAASAGVNGRAGGGGGGGGFPGFLPAAVERIRDEPAIRLAKRIERTGFSQSPILSSCVRPLKQQQDRDPVLLLHGFDRCKLQHLNVSGYCLIEKRPPGDVASKREHLYQFWRSYIRRPMVLVGPSLGAAVAIDFTVNYPEAVSKLIFISASVYAEGTRDMTRMPRFVPYAGVFLLKSLPLRYFATLLAFYKIPGGPAGLFDWVQIGRLHCLLPWWEDALVDFMMNGGYNVLNQINQVKHKCLILWGEEDGIISNKQAYRLHQELPDAILRQVRECGHIPHVEKPSEVLKHVLDFLGTERRPEKAEQGSSLPSTVGRCFTVKLEFVLSTCSVFCKRGDNNPVGGGSEAVPRRWKNWHRNILSRTSLLISCYSLLGC
uniref:AB hydrolase-1 domain-containing protein n=1 Tax=Oryza nivara TaxID=4536 RepID=A0A0E0I3D5_ORYNI